MTEKKEKDKSPIVGVKQEISLQNTKFQNVFEQPYTCKFDNLYMMD